MNTGVTSLANLAEMGAVYPFAGYEWLFTLMAATFLIYFLASQIRMEQVDIRQELAAPGPEAAMAPAE